MNNSEALHWLRVLKDNYGILQPEIRSAVDVAITQLAAKRGPAHICSGDSTCPVCNPVRT